MSPSQADRIVDTLLDLSVVERETWWSDHPEDSMHRAEVEAVLAHLDATRLETRGLATDETALAALADLVHGPLPERIGPYVVSEVLGSGGMGVVFRASQREPAREVAVKVLQPGARTDDLVRRFAREAELLGRLQHPGIAQVIELGHAPADDPRLPGAAYLVMEYVDGRPLDAHAHGAGLDLAGRVRLLADVARAVHHAHLRGVVHRDLKAANVLVTADGQVKVIDFGVAQDVDTAEDATQHTMAGQIVGTLSAMSPEQIRGDRDAVDARTDVYALGVLAYELLGGRPPLDLRGVPLAEAARRVAEVEPPRLGTVEPACRGDLELVVAQALAKEPERRYASAAEFATDLERVLRHEAISARPPSALYLLGRVARRHRLATAALVVALAAIVGGGGFAWREAERNRRLADSESAAKQLADPCVRRQPTEPPGD